MSIETIKLMLDALENHTAIKHPQQAYYRDRAIEAGKTAIAEAEKQEHVACQHKRYSIDVTEQIGTCIDCGSEGRMRFVVDDTHQQPKREPLTLEQRKAIQDEQEWPQMCDPYMYWFFKGVDAAEAAHGIPGVDKTAKQRHKWVGLTDEERRIIINDWQWQEGKPYHLCLSIEAKLKEKNT